METDEYKYFAFISYSRKDSRAAAFVQRELERFRIPIKCVPEEMRVGLRKFVRPVFRDKRDLEVGESNFTTDIKKALEESRYLIVLASPNSAQSRWVDKEIAYFLATHNNDLNRIVPVILCGEPGAPIAQNGCLCPRLCLASIVNRNLPTMIPDEGESEKAGWDAGVVGLLSYMLKVKREDIKSTIDAAKLRRLKAYLLLGVMCSIIFAGLASWAIKAERRATRNKEIAEVNEQRALAGESSAKEKAELAKSTLGFIKGVLEQGNNDSYGSKSVVDLLVEQQLNIEALKPDELRCAVSEIVGDIFFRQSLYIPAERLLKSACEYYRDKSQYRWYSSMDKLALLYGAIGQHEKAQELNNKMEQIHLSVSTSSVSTSSIESKDNRALLLHDIACNSLNNGKIDECLDICTKAIKDSDQGTGSARWLIYELMARAMSRKGDAKNAEIFCQKSFDELKKINRTPTTGLLELYGHICLDSGRFEEAHRAVNKGLQLSLQMNPTSSRTASLYALLGLVERERKKYTAAVRCFESAIEIQKKVISQGGDGASLAYIYCDFGLTLIGMDSYVRAQKILTQAISLIEESYGSESSDIFAPLVNLGIAEEALGNVTVALELYQRAWVVCRMNYGEDTSRAVDVLGHIGRARLSAKDYQASIMAFDEALKISDKNGMPHSPNYIAYLSRKALACYKGGVHSNAVETIKSAVDMAKRNLPEGDPIRKECLINYERICGEQKEMEHNLDSKAKIHDLILLAEQKEKAKEYDEADRLWVEILNELSRIGQEGTTGYANALGNRGEVAFMRGDFFTALSFFRKAIEISRTILGDENGDVASYYYRIGLCLERMKDYYAAEASLEKSCLIYQSMKKVPQRELSQVYMKMSHVNVNLGKYTNALAFCDKAINLDIELNGTNSVEVASAYEWRGDVLSRECDYTNAITNLMQSVSIWEFVENKKKVASLYNKIGNAYYEAKMYSLARDGYLRSFSTNSELYGLTNHESVVTISNIGECELNLGLYTNAIERFEMVTEIQKFITSFSEYDCALAQNRLGVVYSLVGKHEIALEAYQKSLDMFIKLNGRVNHDVITSYENMAKEYKALGVSIEEIRCRKAALDIALALLDDDRSAYDLGLKYYRYSSALSDNSEYNKVIFNCKKALVLFEKCGTNAVDRILPVNCLIGTTYWRMGNKKEAMLAYKNVCDIANRYGIRNSIVEVSKDLYRQCENCALSLSVVNIGDIDQGGYAEKSGLQVGDIWCAFGRYDILKSENCQDVIPEIQRMKDTSKLLIIARKIRDDYEIHTYHFPPGSIGVRLGEMDMDIIEKEKLLRAYKIFLENRKNL